MSKIPLSAMRPLDHCISYNPPDEWWPPGEIFRQYGYWRLRCYGRRIYGKDGIVEKDHVRIYVGEIGGVPLGFEFTHPAARFFVWEEDWMNVSPYANIMRRTSMSPLTPEEVFAACLPYDGTLYDLGQLVDMDLGVRLFDFGKNRRPCSVGGRIIDETLLKENIFPEVEVEKTPPCSWMNTESWMDVAELAS